ncbi:MAG: hypothetical protein PHS44_06020 [Candidatus Dojkabacteria bacterium]|nr:hypothetical protein [Candidatus Dojkabacteria bacterium]
MSPAQEISASDVAHLENSSVSDNRKKKSSALMIAIPACIVLLIILCLVSAVITWVLVKDRDGGDGNGTITSSQTASSGECFSDSDCMIVIRIDECCACPEAVAKSELTSDSKLLAYFPGKNYSSLLPEECYLVDCAPCPEMGKSAGCDLGSCQLVSVSETTTTTVTTTSGNEVEFSLIGSDQSMYGFTLEFTATVPGGAVVDESKNSAKDQMVPTITVSGDDYTFYATVFYEAYEESYSSYEELFNHKTLGRVYRVVGQDGVVSYTNQISTSKKCFDMGTGEDTMPAPCGSTVLLIESNVYFMASCESVGNDYTACDEIIESLEVHVTKL